MRLTGVAEPMEERVGGSRKLRWRSRKMVNVERRLLETIVAGLLREMIVEGEQAAHSSETMTRRYSHLVVEFEHRIR